MAAYQSDLSLFINALKENDPTLENRQLAGRALLWDKAPIDLMAVESDKSCRLPQKPYVYAADSKEKSK